MLVEKWNVCERCGMLVDMWVVGRDVECWQRCEFQQRCGILVEMWNISRGVKCI